MEEAWVKVVELLLNRESNLWLITTMLLIAYIGVSKARLIICKFANKDICKTNKDAVKCEKLTQKDFVYLAVIAAILSVFLLSLSFYTDSDAVTLFSFASTLSSMILSVIAIILTIMSEARNASTKDKLEMSATQIQDASDLLEKLTKKIDPDVLQNIDGKIIRLDGMMKDAIDKIEVAVLNAKETKEVVQRYYFEGRPDNLKVNIPNELEKSEIKMTKYKRGEEDINA